MPGSLLILAAKEGLMSGKNMKLFIGLAVVGILVWWIARSKQASAAVPFGAGAPVAPSVPVNVQYKGLATYPKLMQN